ncbi:MAG: hypothetical protein OEU92_05830, partial [Alphaproteobacteria bacterium]|nr:hypothetical protein [Alphaproteobacteria bacterium]
MMVGKVQLQGLSVIEHMAEAHYAASYRGAPPIVPWYELNELCVKVGDGDLRGGGVSWRCRADHISQRSDTP